MLYDHEGVPRYIGESGDLQHRIWSNHCVGDPNSHKWVCRYNAGRLWHVRNHDYTNENDGKTAKQLRAILARRFCAVRVLPIPELIQKSDRLALERAVQAIAPDPMNDWVNQKRIPASEPEDLVDQLLDDLGWGVAQRSALDRQAELWRRMRAASTA
ncbi:hypothetical protein ACFQXB_17795 [Plastorhodobacter daqingensis]|uniref:GIY-YIG domain-containing protein n=1 Tax=Plastorhodobacter daqingensis TaxID=1387281 RepID=A0ABW2UPW7_9RHOB